MTTTTTTSEMSTLCPPPGGESELKLFRSILERVGDKWSLLVIGVLQPGPLRFTELLRAVPGISRRMLTLTLRQLERDGLISRELFPEIPPRVEYRVTELGHTLAEPVLVIARWVGAHQHEIVRNREEFDERVDGPVDSPLDGPAPSDRMAS
jgi:DNA-binding HxlR family transcriptional regulator